MSASYVDAAPSSSSIPAGAYPFGRLSTHSNTPRRSSSSKARLANDARHVATSPDVISTLLASFSSISVPSEDSHLHPALRTQSLRLSSVGSQHQYSLSPNTAPSPIIDFAPSTRHSSFTTATWAPDDAAEPPIVRTNRSSVSHSGFAWSRSKSSPKVSLEQANSKNGIVDIGTGDWSAELLQPDDQLSPLPSDTITFSGNHSPILYRASLDGTSNESESQSRRSSFSRDVKGKGRATEAPATRPPRVDIYDSYRYGGVLTPSTPGSRWTSRHSTARSSVSNGTTTGPMAGPSRTHRRLSSVDHTTKEYKTKERMKSYQSLEANGPTFLESKVVVPPRGSSLKRVDSLTLLRKRASARSSVSLATEANTYTIVPDEDIDQDDIDSNGEELEVLKRIKELKAANEARRRSLKDQNNYDASDTPLTYSHLHSIKTQYTPPRIILQQTPSRTTLVGNRAVEVSQPDDARPSMSGRSDNSFAISSTISSSNRVSVDILPVEYVNFSRDRPVVVRSISPQKFRGSVDSAQIQKNLINLKRWSQPVPEHRSGDSRDISSRGSPLARPTIAEDRTSSGPVVSDSVSTYLQSPRLSQKVYLQKENRSITFSEVGDPNGHVIFCCVGMGMTRYIMTFYDELATSLKLRLITPDRPGIGDSEAYPDGQRKPITWPDDVEAICDLLGIATFSLLAHSAGAIYALATALRMPSQIHGKIHLLAPWIPPSQMIAPVINGDSSSLNGSSPGRVLPRSQRFLRILPTPFLKLSNSSWALNAAFARSKRPKSNTIKNPMDRFRYSSDTNTSGPSPRISFGQLRAAISRRPSDVGDIPIVNLDDVLLSSIPDHSTPVSSYTTGNNSISSTTTATETPPTPTAPPITRPSFDSVLLRQRRYDAALTPAIWELATKNANPAVDLLVCLERQQTIGFRYADVDVSSVAERDLNIEQMHREDNSPTGIGVATGTGYNASAHTFSTERVLNGGRGGTNIVIHHGSKDARVPLANVKWLAKTMKATEVRVIEGEGHGLMACAGVMSGVLTEMAKEMEELAGTSV